MGVGGYWWDSTASNINDTRRMDVLVTSVNSRRPSAWWRHCSETVFFRDNFVIFRRRSKRIAFLESVNFSTCGYMHIFTFRDGHVTTFRPFRGLYLPNAWWQTLQTSKRHTFRVSAFHRCHWFGVKLFPVGWVQDSRRYPKTLKCCFWIWLRPRYKIPEFFTIAPIFTSTLTVCRRNRGDPSSLQGAAK